MIAYLEGEVQKKLSNAIIINTGGVGYLVHVNKNFLNECEENMRIEAYTHTSVRENDISIFGFQNIPELEMFKLLISVSGIGPKTGLEILNNKVASLKYAIANGDIDLLVQTPGIGKKTAERVILDLQGKITDAIQKPGDYIENIKDVNEDAINALENLGYRKHQIIQTLKKLPENIKDPEEIIRYFLQNA
ncbi:Holliday junction branch migration protein RuvA [Patescibacteria group bacterium]|nr:Holliday junction branch migration protein RuvA [Patescibacteria group bacterium]